MPKSGTQTTQQSGGASKTPNPVSVSGFIALLPTLMVLLENIISGPNEHPVLKKAVDTAKCAEDTFGPCAATESAWHTVALLLRKLDRIDEAKSIESEKCQYRTGCVDLIGLSNSVKLDEEGNATNPKKIDNIVQTTTEPFYIITGSGYKTLRPNDASKFVVIYTALRRDLAQLSAWFKELDLVKYVEFEDPSKYDIAQLSLNTVYTTTEYLSITKRTHAHQFIGCNLFESSNYRKAAVSFWSALIERLFKSSVFKFGNPDFASHEAVDAVESATSKKMETLNERHVRFSNDMYRLIKTLLMAVNELANPQHGSKIKRSAYGSTVVYNLSPECNEQMQEVEKTIKKMSNTEGLPKKYKRIQTGIRQVPSERHEQYKRLQWFRKQLGIATTPKPFDSGHSGSGH